NYIGLRPGEKMDERLWTEEDTVIKTGHPGIIKVLHRTRLNGQLENLLKNLQAVCYLEGDENLYRNRIYLREILKEYIPSIKMVKNEPEY
ncbi:MAG: polysaccharide biosynthesis protein, partial [Spirochaetales bacterium]|nr:polysaccharide biosynthesis protein [Spirochaetales bacterium]